MKILVLQAHPNMSKSILNKRFSKELEGKNNIKVRNLYALYPNWEIDAEKEQKELLEADRVVFQFPFYWYNMTPLLKKYFDDIFLYGFAYGVEGDKLKGKEFVIATTAGGPDHAYQPGEYNNFSMGEFLRPMQQTAKLAGMEFRKAFIVNDAVRIGQENDPEKLTELATHFIQHITDPYLDPIAKLKKLNDEIKEKGGIN
ncbi:glutathione-regulated potassium-efflux system ancillary protein KefG [Flavobacteriaceae bacterium UJ101]|nr:glutathione-regulated potassium-efflux system ancillary protein KefG [Flavobacteriaceae bacterium UJ101]